MHRRIVRRGVDPSLLSSSSLSSNSSPLPVSPLLSRPCMLCLCYRSLAALSPCMLRLCYRSRAASTCVLRFCYRSLAVSTLHASPLLSEPCSFFCELRLCYRSYAASFVSFAFVIGALQPLPCMLRLCYRSIAAHLPILTVANRDVPSFDGSVLERYSCALPCCGGCSWSLLAGSRKIWSLHARLFCSLVVLHPSSLKGVSHG